MDDFSTPTPNLSPSEPLGDWKKYDPRYRAVADYFGIEPNREWGQYSDKIDYLYNWSKAKTKTDDVNQNLLAIRDLEKKVGGPAWNERRIVNVYRNLKLNETDWKAQAKKELPKVEVKKPDTLASSIVSMKQSVAEKIQKSISQTLNKEIKTALKTQVDGLKDALKSI